MVAPHVKKQMQSASFYSENNINYIGDQVFFFRGTVFSNAWSVLLLYQPAWALEALKDQMNLKRKWLIIQRCTDV